MKRLLLLINLLVCFFATSQTTLEKGDVMVLGVNANINTSCGYPSITISGTNFNSIDAISIVALRNIPNGTLIDITDNAWQRNNNNRFGNNEGALRFNRTGGTISAGTIFQLIIVSYNNNVSRYESALSHNTINPDWTVTSISNSAATTGVNVAVAGDQVLIMNGGIWNNGSGSHNSQYNNSSPLTAKILFGYNTKKSWNSLGDSANESALPGDETDDPTNFDIKNYHYSSTITNSTVNETKIDFQFYDGSWTEVSKNEWLMRFMNPNYWGSVDDCSEYESNLDKSPIAISTSTIPIEVCKDEPITITVDDNSIVTYQWYQTPSLTNIGGTLITGETNFDFNPPTNIAGTFYYYCQMTYTLRWTINGSDRTSSQTLPSLPFQITISNPITSPVIPL